jgi:hypothetical protein
MIEINLLNGFDNAHQTFFIQLGDNYYKFDVNYITLAGPAWSVDLSVEGVKKHSGIMLNPAAVYDIEGGKLVFVGEDVTLHNLGVDNKLVWVPNV